MPEHRQSDRSYKLDPRYRNMEQQGGTFAPAAGSPSRFWSRRGRQPEEGRAPDEQKPGNDAESKADAAAISNEKPSGTDTTGIAADAASLTTKSGEALAPSGNDPPWVVVPDPDAPADDDDWDKRTFMEFNFWIGWGRWKHKMIEFKVWKRKDAASVEQ